MGRYRKRNNIFAAFTTSDFYESNTKVHNVAASARLSDIHNVQNPNDVFVLIGMYSYCYLSFKRYQLAKKEMQQLLQYASKSLVTGQRSWKHNCVE